MLILVIEFVVKVKHDFWVNLCFVRMGSLHKIILTRVNSSKKGGYTGNSLGEEFDIFLLVINFIDMFPVQNGMKLFNK